MEPHKEPRRRLPTRLKLSWVTSARVRVFQIREQPSGESNVETAQGSEIRSCNQGGCNRGRAFGYFARRKSPAAEHSGANPGGDSRSGSTVGCSVRPGAKGDFAGVRSAPGAPSIGGPFVGDHVTNADQ